MKKVLLVSLGLLCLAGAALAGNNAGVQAYISWSSTNNTTTNLQDPTGFSTLFVRVGNIHEFKGGEVDLIWDPVGDGPLSTCYGQNPPSFPISAGTSCKNLNRGNAAGVTTVNVAGHMHFAWANDQALLTCTAGNIAQVLFDFTDCVDPTGCFGLTQCLVLDQNSGIDNAGIAGPVVTVNGGTGHNCAAVPVEPGTWGKIKALYHRS